ncbi:MAG: hypothetical protein IPM93_25400 [Candidatus Obscuribacter sp.]|nr:hypothetical protein [Candidatus Obscuribacter sp.]
MSTTALNAKPTRNISTSSIEPLDGEIKVETALCQILLAGLIPNEELVKERAATKPASPPDITVLALTSAFTTV